MLPILLKSTKLDLTILPDSFWYQFAKDLIVYQTDASIVYSSLYKLELIDTENVLAGYHYYAKDDEKFNSYDKTPGAWLSGQSRTFKIDSNKILDCKNIYIFGSRFTVTMGIGDS